MSGMSRTEYLAKVLAWAELNDHGRKTCDWKRDFAPSERKRYRLRARYIIREMEKIKVKSP